jgi:hypothetical protein
MTVTTISTEAQLRPAWWGTAPTALLDEITRHFTQENDPLAAVEFWRALTDQMAELSGFEHTDSEYCLVQHLIKAEVPGIGEQQGEATHTKAAHAKVWRLLEDHFGWADDQRWLQEMIALGDFELSDKACLRKLTTPLLAVSEQTEGRTGGKSNASDSGEQDPNAPPRRNFWADKARARRVSERKAQERSGWIYALWGSALLLGAVLLTVYLGWLF